VIVIEKILFPVDLSESVNSFIPYVVTMTRKFNATLYIATVTPDVSSITSFFVPHTDIRSLQYEVQQGAAHHIKALADRLEGVERVEVCVLVGDPADQIIDLARQEEIDLIIMGTRGRSGLQKSIFGSVCDRVIRSAICPVFTISPMD